MESLIKLWDDMKRAYKNRAYKNNKPYYWIAFSVGVIVAGSLGTLFGAF